MGGGCRTPSVRLRPLTFSKAFSHTTYFDCLCDGKRLPGDSAVPDLCPVRVGLANGPGAGLALRGLHPATEISGDDGDSPLGPETIPGNLGFGMAPAGGDFL